MIHWNPVPHVQHAWSGTNTVWGKIALVLFYSFIWLGILSCAWIFVVPASQGLDCVLNVAGTDDDARAVMTALLRGAAVLFIGFLLYADVGGLKVKNGAMVFIFATIFYLNLIPILHVSECGAVQVWFWPSWALLALIFMVIDDKLADRGTAEETTSLTV